MQAAMTQVAPDESFDEIRFGIRRVFDSQQQIALEWRDSTTSERIARVLRLRDAVLANRESLYEAAYQDFRKPRVEVDLGEIMPVLHSAKSIAKNLAKWMKPQKVGPTMTTLGSSAKVEYQPRGRCLIIAPWNFPVNLGFVPVLTALAAGNTVIFKPSEMAPRMSAWMARVIKDTFPSNEVAVFEGGVETAGALLDLPFDHCFFTGSPAVGKRVMQAASRHLTSVTLELGGKSPTIVDASADVQAAAENIVWGKLVNNGQICVSPDHVFVERSVRDAFVRYATAAIRARYGETDAEQRQSPDLARVVNTRHAARLEALVKDAQAKGAQLLCGGATSVEESYVAPTLMADVPDDAKIMSEEIFGPVLPIITFDDLDKVIDQINAEPKPLALYVFSKNQSRIDSIVRRTSSGGVCVNHVLMQFNHGKLPFGGVNNSGLGGAYHGVWGFRCFSHERAVMQQHILGMKMFYPPYTPTIQKMLMVFERLTR